MTRPLFRSALVLACAAVAPALVVPARPAAAQAQAHPDLSGTWELNVAASDFGMQGAQGAAPSKGTLVIMQRGDSLTRTQTMSTPMGDASNTMHYRMGAARTDTIAMGGQSVPVASTTRWDGAVLVVDAKATMMGTEIPVLARYTLSPDGKRLMVDQTVTTPMGEQKTHFVFDKKG